MAAKQEPLSGIYYEWALGESGWNQQMDANLLKLGRMWPNLIVLDRNLTDPPATPTNGDAYIPAATATGDWVGQEDNVVFWDANVGAWEVYTPREGWLVYIVDEAVISVYKSATGWSAGLSI